MPYSSTKCRNRLHCVLVGTNNCCHRKVWVLFLEPWGWVEKYKVVGDEIKFHSPFKSLCSRWRFPFSHHAALAQQIQKPPTLRPTQWVLTGTQCPAVQRLFLMPRVLQLRAKSRGLCPLSAPILLAHACCGMEGCSELTPFFPPAQ